jgi:signal peptidase I
MDHHTDARIEPAAEAAPGRGRTAGWLIELIETLVLTLVIFFGIQWFVAQPFQVEQYSMERTFEQGDYVLIDKLSPRWDDYSRGDIVVFTPPPGSTSRPEPFIKRVIGEPGDRVEVRPDGLVYVNGVALAEPYLYRGEDGNPEPTLPGDGDTWTVPEGELFVMGDHRMASDDSRSFGPILISSVIGRGALRYWPLSTLSFVTAPVYAGVPAP